VGSLATSPFGSSPDQAARDADREVSALLVDDVLTREFAVTVDMTWGFTILAASADDAKQIAESIYFEADGNYESYDHWVDHVDVIEVDLDES